MWIIWAFGSLLWGCDTLCGGWFSHLQPAIHPPRQELARSTLGLGRWLSGSFGSIGRRPRPNKTASKRKSDQVLLCLDSPDVIYSLVYEVFFLTPLAGIHTLCHFRVHTSCHMVTMCPEQVNRLGDSYKGRKL